MMTVVILMMLLTQQDAQIFEAERVAALAEFRAAQLAEQNAAIRARLNGRHGQIATLYRAIEHGDDEHRKWLREALDAHFKEI